MGRSLFDSARSNPGRSVDLPADDRLHPILELKGGDDCAEMVTVAVRAEKASPLVAGDIVRARAVILWGTGGASHEVEIDAHPGAILSVPASFIKVSVANEGTQATLKASAVAARGGRGGRLAPARTRYVGSVSDGAFSSQLDVPNFASAVDVVRNPATVEINVRIYDANDNIVGIARAAANAAFSVTTLPGDADAIDIGPVGAALTAARVIFTLAL